MPKGEKNHKLGTGEFCSCGKPLVKATVGWTHADGERHCSNGRLPLPELSNRQTDVLLAIVPWEWRKESEIGLRTGMAPLTVHDHCLVLQRLGLVEWKRDDKGRRSWRLRTLSQETAQ